MSAAHPTDSFALGDRPLTLELYAAVADRQLGVTLSDEARRYMMEIRASLLKQLGSGAAIYGVNTGYGADSTRRLAPETIRIVQRNTILSHAVGVGPQVPRRIVRGMLLLKAAGLAKGYSAVRPELVDLICGLLNEDILPLVSEQGSLAASGDLVPSGHMGLALIGEGEVDYAGRRVTAEEALQSAGLAALNLEEKEGLALVNGTAFTEAYALEVVMNARHLVKTADIAGAASLQAMKGHLGAFSKRGRSPAIRGLTCGRGEHSSPVRGIPTAHRREEQRSRSVLLEVHASSPWRIAGRPCLCAERGRDRTRRLHRQSLDL